MQRPPSLDALNALIRSSPPFVKGSPRAVLGEGPIGAALALVGEQPGDREDVEGHPFVGPAGQLLNQALADAHIARERCYVTNAVKHFKFVQQGKRRLHQKPTLGEIKRYRWWLELELDFVAPVVIIAMGRSAAAALLDKAVRISGLRGPAELLGRPGYITVHPSFLLRQSTSDDREANYRAFVEDLSKAHAIAKGAGAA